MIAVLKPHSRDGERVLAEQTFGARLRQLREAAGLTQQQLAERAEMDRNSLAKLEQDLYSPTWPTVQKLAAALGTNCLAFEGTVEPPPPAERQARPKGRPKKAPPPPPPAGQEGGKPAAQPEAPARGRGRKRGR